MPDEILEEKKEDSFNKTRELNEKVNERLSKFTNRASRYDKTRLGNKFMLKELINTWEIECQNRPEIIENDTELQSIMNEVEAYANMDVTGTRALSLDKMSEEGTYATEELVNHNVDDFLNAGYQEEQDSYVRIMDKLGRYQERLEREDANDGKRETETEEAWKAREQVKNARYLMAINLQMYFEGQRDGYLEPVPKGAHHLKEKNLQNAEGVTKTISMKDAPLFPHDPSPTDIRQGSFGDCYIESSLTAIVNQNPQKIKECMCDNGDGTVTVRFFYREMPAQQGENPKPYDVMKPFYVTVNKEIPEGAGNKRCLWVSLMVRAYAVAGLREFDGTILGERYNKPAPVNADELYNKYKEMSEWKRPVSLEAPWLYDKDQKLKPWKANYESVVRGGQSELFLESLLGDEGEWRGECLHDAVDLMTDKRIYEHLLHLVEVKTSKEYAENLRNTFSVLDTKLQMKNASDILVLLHDTNHPMDWENQVITLREDGQIQNMPQNEATKVMEKYCDELKNVLTKERVEAYGKQYDLGMSMDTMYPRVFDGKTNNPIIAQLQSSLRQEKNHFIKVYNEEYMPEELQFWENIRDEIKKGSYITGGTIRDKAPDAPERQDDKMINGLFCGHSYAVVGTRTETDKNGNELKFVLLRNPHGTNLYPIYDYSTRPLKVVKMENYFQEGFIKIELKHFMNSFQHVEVNRSIKPEERQANNSPTLVVPEQLASYMKLYLELYNEETMRLAKEKNNPLKNRYMTAMLNMGKDLKRGEDSIGKDMSNITLRLFNRAWSDVEQGHNILYGDKNKNLPNALKGIRKLANLMEDLEGKPLEGMLKGISGRVLYEKKPWREVLEIYGEHEFGNGIGIHANEAKELLEMISNVDPTYMSSSKEFSKMKKCTKELNDFAKTFKKETNNTNFKNYFNKLAELQQFSNEYVNYKINQRRTPDGKVVYKNENEKMRVETAKQINRYAAVKRKGLELEYLRFQLAQAIYSKVEDVPETDQNLKHDEICELSSSYAFKKMVRGKTPNELSEIIKNQTKREAFAEEVKAEAAKHNPINDIYRYYRIQKRNLNMLIREPKKNKEAIENTVAKLTYAHLCTRKYPNADFGSIKANASAHVNKIKQTDAFKKLMRQKINNEFVNTFESAKYDNVVKSIETAMNSQPKVSNPQIAQPHP